MKTKEVTISIRPTKDVLQMFAKTLHDARKGKKIKPHREISFESIDALRKTLTKERLNLISIIKHQHPQSMYELAKIANRDLKSVNTDIKILEQFDFIELERVKEGREKIVPKVLFDDIKITVQV